MDDWWCQDFWPTERDILNRAFPNLEHIEYEEGWAAAIINPRQS